MRVNFINTTFFSLQNFAQNSIFQQSTYYDFNVCVHKIYKKYELWSCIRAAEGFLKVLTFTMGAERKLYAWGPHFDVLNSMNRSKGRN